MCMYRNYKNHDNNQWNTKLPRFYENSYIYYNSVHLW
jgi:hypothetical protein